jgi:hypothetical protein
MLTQRKARIQSGGFFCGLLGMVKDELTKYSVTLFS